MNTTTRHAWAEFQSSIRKMVLQQAKNNHITSQQTQPNGPIDLNTRESIDEFVNTFIAPAMIREGWSARIKIDQRIGKTQNTSGARITCSYCHNEVLRVTRGGIVVPLLDQDDPMWLVHATHVFEFMNEL